MYLDSPLDYYGADEAIDSLSACLYEGNLVLFLGAGISKNIGLPIWWELVRRCVNRVGGLEGDEINEYSSNEELREAMEGVERRAESFQRYQQIIYEQMYSGVEYGVPIISKPLLISLASLIMPSRRGSVNEVVTFNYDDVMEWYLGLHGYVTNIIYEEEYVLNRRSDVTMYHPHGYLPRMRSVTNRSDYLIMSQYSYDDRMGKAQEVWKQRITRMLLENVGLFVGLSGEDPTFGPFLADIKSRLNGRRPTAIWLLGPKDKKSREYFYERNVVPIKFEKYDEWVTFLLGICQKSREKYLA